MRPACSISFMALLAGALSAGSASASQLNLQFQDFALPGAASSYRVLGGCNATGTFVFPADSCGYLSGPLASVSSQTDKTLVVAITPDSAGSAATPYDRYVTFRESGANPAPVDDILRVQWDPAGNALLVSFISGSLVSNYLTNDLANAELVGSYVSGINEEFYFGDRLQFAALHSTFGGNPFSFELDEGPRFAGLGAYPVVLGVVPTAVPLPGTLALSLAAFSALIGTRRARRHRQPDSSAQQE